jgi:hypothetical protein
MPVHATPCYQAPSMSPSGTHLLVPVHACLPAPLSGAGVGGRTVAGEMELRLRNWGEDADDLRDLPTDFFLDPELFLPKFPFLIQK